MQIRIFFYVVKQFCCFLYCSSILSVLIYKYIKDWYIMAYFLKQVKQKSGRIFLEIVDSVYVKRKKSSKHVVFKKIGYLDELEKDFKDPISHFKKEASDLEIKRKQEFSSQIPIYSSVKNLGSFVFYHLLNKLSLSNVFKPIDFFSKRDYKPYDVFEFLTLCRIIDPSSRLDSYSKHLNSFFKA